MSHTKGFFVRLKRSQRDYLDVLAARYGLKSAAAAFIRTLQRTMAEDEPPQMRYVRCPSCKREAVTVNVNRYAVCPDEKCATLFSQDAKPVVYRIPARVKMAVAGGIPCE